MNGNVIKILKLIILLAAARFLFVFIKDSYEELFFNPVHFFEDAYMFIRYAKIWHLGYGESWNIGEGPVYGNTSQLHFLWVLLLTSFSLLSDDAIIKISSYVPAFIFIAWLPWFCTRHSPLFASHRHWQKYLLWLGLICLFIYSSTPFTYHYLTGMDTSLSLLLHLLLIDAVLSYGNKSSAGKNTPYSFLLIIVLIYAAFLTRPENILACTLFSLFYILLVLKEFNTAKKLVLSIALVIVIDSGIKYLYFGDFLPLAFYSKKSSYIQGNIGAGFSHPAFYFFYFLATIVPLIVIQLFAARNDNLIKQAVFILPALLTLTYFFTMMTVMNMKGRYFYPFTPYFIAAAITTFDPSSFQPRQYLKNIALLFVALFLYIGTRLADQHNGDIVNLLLRDQQPCEDSLKLPAEDFGGIGYRVDTEGFDHLVAILKDAPPDLRVAMTENGYVGAKLPHINIIDMAGLHNPYVARHGLTGKWLFDQMPDMIWMPHWHYTCMTHELLYNDFFWSHYKFYPGLFTWGLALRVDSKHYPLLNNNLEKQVSAIYPHYHLADFEKSILKIEVDKIQENK